MLTPEQMDLVLGAAERRASELLNEASGQSEKVAKLTLNEHFRPLRDAIDAMRAHLGGEDPRPTALLPEDRANFDTLMQAAANDDVFLMHAREKTTGHGHALICIKSTVPGSDDVDVIPVARVLDEDPTETYTNPAED
ncbi:MAG: hypothetical protein QOF36_2612 [Microbacteriaceae bacterium]|jgi:hypothetical protein|nr:hypothetical protein [Microbacteriaceae bacterium]